MIQFSLVIHCYVGFFNLLLNLKMRWLKKLKALNIWSLIGLLIVGIATISSFIKGLNSEKVFIGILGFALLFNLFG